MFHLLNTPLAFLNGVPCLAQSGEWDVESRTIWLLLLIAISVYFIYSSAVSGYREGVFRRIVALLAIIMAYLSGWLFSGAMGALLSNYWQYPQPVLQIIGGAALGICVWLAIKCSIWLVPRTADFNSVFMIYMVGNLGVLMGALTGMLYALLLFMSVQVLGTVAEFRLSMIEPPVQNQVPDAGSMHDDVQAEKEANAGADSSAILSAAVDSINPLHAVQYKSLEILAQIKNSVTESYIAPAVMWVDPIPAKAYRILDRLRDMIQEPEALKIFMQHSLSKEILEHPDVVALSEDKSIMKLAEDKDIDALLSHPKLLAVTDNPELQSMVVGFDIEKAMDDALNEAARRSRLFKN